MFRAVVLIALVACGDNVLPDNGEARSGDRLKLTWLEYEGGTRQRADRLEMHDAQRGEDCSLAVWSDGLTYCTPATIDAVYADAECTTEVGRIPSDTDMPRYVLHRFFLNDELLPSRLHGVGAPAASPNQTFELHGESCVEASDFDPRDTYVELGAEIPKSELALVGAKELPGEGVLGLVIDTSADGMRQQAAVNDRDRGETCHVERRGDATSTRCVPQGQGFSFEFLDAACSRPALAVDNGFVLPELVTTILPSGCFAFHPLGELTLERSVYFKSGNVCTEVPVDPATRVFELAPALLSPGMRRVHAGDGRMQLIEDGTIRFIDTYLFDELLGHDCRPIELGGVTRCVPDLAEAIVRFADSTCQTEVPVVIVPTSTCSPPLRFSRGSPSTPRRDQIRAIIGPSPVVYEITTGDRCVESVAGAGFEYRALGPVLPFETFAAAQRIRD